MTEAHHEPAGERDVQRGGERGARRAKAAFVVRTLALVATIVIPMNAPASPEHSAPPGVENAETAT
jgi:hypothetical protein